ncbi:hypothetical protein [Rhizobium mesoamericanum]|uniref:hypothetical protein n=1 Tax=Rhizobium mesoamericanum TaxID=1079800 RepID=UPI0004258A47|nr:hypothetical protein [Rhizobium mesoamericanum]
MASNLPEGKDKVSTISAEIIAATGDGSSVTDTDGVDEPGKTLFFQVTLVGTN